VGKGVYNHVVGHSLFTPLLTIFRQRFSELCLESPFPNVFADPSRFIFQSSSVAQVEDRVRPIAEVNSETGAGPLSQVTVAVRVPPSCVGTLVKGEQPRVTNGAFTTSRDLSSWTPVQLTCMDEARSPKCPPKLVPCDCADENLNLAVLSVKAGTAACEI